MKKMGMVGGLSWRSTARYYHVINEAVAQRKGGLHSAPLLIESVDFAEVARCATQDDWDCASGQIVGAARRLEGAGADAIMICANSMHRIYDDVAGAVGIPVLHIAEAVGAKMQADGIKSAAIVGTRNVMTEKFYRQRLVSFGVSLQPPDMALADQVDRIVYEELSLGKTVGASERLMKSAITDIAKRGAEALVLGATELEMIVDTRANVLPIYDSTVLHAKAAVEFILSE